MIDPAIHDLSGEPEDLIKLDEHHLAEIKYKRDSWCRKLNELLVLVLTQLGYLGVLEQYFGIKLPSSTIFKTLPEG